MASNPSFGTNTKGADIIEAFPSNVQKKTCISHTPNEPEE